MNRISQYASHASSAMHMLSCMDQPRPDSTPSKLLTGVQFLNAGQKWLYCSKRGISKRCLISACQPSEATFSGLTRLFKVPKGLVLELFKFKNSKHLSWSSLGIWLSHIYGKPVNHTEIQQELRKMREFECKLSKNKQKDKLNDFCEELFEIPPFSLNSSTSLSSNPSNSSRNADIDKQLQKKVQEKQSKIKNLKRQLRR